MLAAVAMALVWLPGHAMYVALGSAILGWAMAWIAFRQTHRRGWARLAGAGALTLATLAATLACVRYGFTLLAIDKLESMLG